MTNPTTQPSQAAREAAAAFFENTGWGERAASIRAGVSGTEQAPLVQAFARFERDTEKRVRESEAELRQKFRMFLSHATGGRTSDVNISLNDMSVMASQKVNDAWNCALEKGRKEGRESLAAEEWDGPLTAEEQAMIDGAWERHKAAAPCTIPPKGWRCTRAAGHDGPCAALSVESLAGEANVERVALCLAAADGRQLGNEYALHAYRAGVGMAIEYWNALARAALATLERTTDE